MIQITVTRIWYFQSPKADVVQRLIVYAVAFVGVFDQLVDGQGGIVRFHHRIGHFR